MAKDYHVNWNGREVRDLTLGQVRTGISRATLTLEREMKELISQKGEILRRQQFRMVDSSWLYTGSHRPRKSRRKIKGKGRAVRARSKPGEPPFVDTGTLRSSIGHEMREQGLVGRVGTGLKYGRHLELGTANMAPRPYMRPTHDKIVSQIERFFPAPF